MHRGFFVKVPIIQRFNFKAEIDLDKAETRGRL